MAITFVKSRLTPLLLKLVNAFLKGRKIKGARIKAINEITLLHVNKFYSFILEKVFWIIKKFQ